MDTKKFRVGSIIRRKIGIPPKLRERELCLVVDTKYRLRYLTPKKTIIWICKSNFDEMFETVIY